MISFRYHLLTIVAIFLAIALGIVMGATFVQDPLLDRLKSQTEALQGDNERLRAQLTELREDLDSIADFSEEVMPYAIADELSGVPVVLLAQEGTAGAALDGARAALEQSGALVEASLWIETRMAALDEESRAELAAALGIPADPVPSRPAVLEAAVEVLGSRLADGGDEPDVLSGQDSAADPDDPLRDLLTGGFLTSPDLSASELPSVGGPGAVTVVVGGGPPPRALDPESFLVPLLEDLSERGVVAAAAEGTDPEFPFVAMVRGDGDVNGSVVTVEAVDRPQGAIALVLALRQVLDGGTAGHYGPGSDRLLPAPPADS